jgi:hypothetical protein
LHVGGVGEAIAAPVEQGHRRERGQQPLGVALADADGAGHSRDGVVAVGDRGEDLELDRGHQRGALPIGLRHLLQPRRVESLLLRHVVPPLREHSARA